MSQSIPKQLGKYKILDEIGQGGFGDVYRAEDTMLGSTVALKVLAPAYMRDPSVVKRFQQEARAAARLHHPHIVRIYDLGQDEGVLYLAMDHLPGRTLAEIIRDKGPLPLEQVADLLGQVASALDYAHGQGLIHRDVKPGNVMVSDGGHATLMDFGLVKAADHTQFTVLYRTADSEQFTTGGGTIGTPEYMAPEQADPALGKVGPPTDLYALGVVAYQMLTGRVPFQASTPVATLRAHADLPPPPPSQWADLPDEVVAVVLRALAKQPGERWPSAGAFAEALAEAVKRSLATRAQAAHMETLYAQAAQALADRQWALALGLCGQIMARVPTYRQVGELFEQANAGLARQRAWEAQQEGLGYLYDQAMQQMAEEQWDDAILVLMHIVDANPTHTFRDVPQKLAEAKAARAQAEAERLARIEALESEWQATLAHAVTLLAEWRELEPDSELVTTTNDALRDLEEHWLPPAQPEPAEEIEPDVEVEPEPAPTAKIEIAEPAPPPVPVEVQLQPWERLPFEPEMVYVPAGEFLMGSADDDPNARNNEKPQRRVYLDAYCIGRYPVTNAQYKAFVDETGHRPPTHWKKGLFKTRIEFPEEKQEHPVVYVSWEDAVAYCRWLSQKTERSYRLPTEAEWEKAGRGTDGRIYPWGNKWDRGKCNSSGGKGGTTPVGAYSPPGDSPYGCADMAGNAWEWVNDRYNSKYYSHSPTKNPKGPDSGASKVLRGGGWFDNWRNVRAAVRDHYHPTFRYNDTGFRCAAGLPRG